MRLKSKVRHLLAAIYEAFVIRSPLIDHWSLSLLYCALADRLRVLADLGEIARLQLL